MRHGHIVMPLLLSLLTHCGARAEMSGAEYVPDGVLATPAERQRAREHIEAERVAEAARATAREAEADAERARQIAAYARLPAGERLTAEHCGACHALDSLASIHHTLPGWHLVIARMRYWNGADIPYREARLIAAHLAARQPARGVRRVVEALALSGPLWLAAGVVWWRRKTARKCMVGT